MKKEKKILVVEAAVENIEKVTEFVDEHLLQWNCPVKARMQILIAIDELFGNIAHYAYKELPGEASVEVEASEEPMAVSITFIDRGIPFDPLAKADPDISLPEEERQPGGLGVYMVKQSMDGISYRYENGRNILQIRKNF